MIRQVLTLIAASFLMTNGVAGSSASCGSKVTCKPGEKAKCEMVNGSTTIFLQASFLNLTSKTDLFLKELYAYKTGTINTVDCYYSQEEFPENWLVFKTGPIHNVIPRDAKEWVKREDLLHCDPDLNECLLYALY